MQQAAAAVGVAEGEEKEVIRCPRCESSNTKFCYYNNYNLSQPRHFCKDCRRYWTKGGSLRNVPVGGGTRKNCKRAAPAAAAGGGGSKRPNTASSGPILTSEPEPISFYYQGVESEDKILDIGESFSSLLASGETFRSMLDTFHIGGGGGGGGGFGGFPVVSGDSIRTAVAAPAVAELQSSNDSGGGGSENPATPQLENLMGLQDDPSPWAGGWPDHAIYMPGSGFR